MERQLEIILSLNKEIFSRGSKKKENKQKEKVGRKRKMKKITSKSWQVFFQQ
jgi:hypothetical protein